MLATGGRRSTGLIREWKRECYPILVTDGSRNVTFARCVFSQLDVPRSQVNLLTSRQFNLSLPAERNHIFGVVERYANLEPFQARSGAIPLQ